MKTRIHVVQGDITKLAVDVIVNAANPSLMGGGGVDGAIHRAAGPALLDACLKVRQQQGDCPTGHAVITLAGALPAKAVVHTVGPVWRGGEQNEDQLLQDAYLNSLRLVAANSYIQSFNMLLLLLIPEFQCHSQCVGKSFMQGQAFTMTSLCDLTSLRKTMT